MVILSHLVAGEGGKKFGCLMSVRAAPMAKMPALNTKRALVIGLLLPNGNGKKAKTKMSKTTHQCKPWLDISLWQWKFY